MIHQRWATIGSVTSIICSLIWIAILLAGRFGPTGRAQRPLPTATVVQIVGQNGQQVPPTELPAGMRAADVEHLIATAHPLVFEDGAGYNGMRERRARDQHDNYVVLLAYGDRLAIAQVVGDTQTASELATDVTRLTVPVADREAAQNWVAYQVRGLSAPGAAFEASVKVGSAQLEITGRHGGFSYRITLP